MIRLANDSNIQQVLAELKEYATEVDVDFVRKCVLLPLASSFVSVDLHMLCRLAVAAGDGCALRFLQCRACLAFRIARSVRAIGRCAIKVAGSAQRCVDTLLDLIQTKVNYVVQEAIVVIKDIFRKCVFHFSWTPWRSCALSRLSCRVFPAYSQSRTWQVPEQVRVDYRDTLREPRHSG
jgi:vesicle coat complex subunit